jgi:hypothetical protein
MPGHAGVLHHPVHRRHGRLDPHRAPSSELRRGVMELYLSDHPRTAPAASAATARCRRSRARPVLAEVRYGLGGANHLDEATDTSNPYFAYDPEGLHRLLPLRARLRRGPGHLRPHRRRAGASTRGSPPVAPNFLTPSASPAAPASRRARPTRSPRSRSSSWGCRRAPSSRRAPTAGSAARSRPRCRAAATTPGSCGWCRGRTAAPTRATAASRAASPTATPRTATGSCRRWSATRSTTSGRSSRGRRPSPASPRASSPCARSTAWVRSAASPRRGAPTKRSTSSRRWCGPRSATTTSTPARGCATPPPGTGSTTRSAPPPAPRTSPRSSRPTSCSSSAPTPPTPTRSSRRG